MRNAPTSEPWVSIDDAAAHLGVRKDSVYRWIQHRGLPAEKIGKLWKLKLSEVDAWMRSGSHRRKRPEDDVVPPPAPKATILVVDDDQTFRESLGDFLSDKGYRATLAGDGEEALALLRTASGPKPALIILDLVMPGMDGWRFREEQARHDELRDIPVLLMSAEFRVQLTSADVICKPLDLPALDRAIGRLVGATR